MKLSWLLLLVALTSCKRDQHEARDKFSDRHSCPADRVEVKARTDLKPSSFRSPSGEPPDEIKRDPGRYEYWKHQQQESLERSDAGWACYEVTGCGHHEIMCCADADTGGVMCLEETRD